MSHAAGKAQRCRDRRRRVSCAALALVGQPAAHWTARIELSMRTPSGWRPVLGAGDAPAMSWRRASRNRNPIATRRMLPHCCLRADMPASSLIAALASSLMSSSGPYISLTAALSCLASSSSLRALAGPRRQRISSSKLGTEFGRSEMFKLVGLMSPSKASYIAFPLEALGRGQSGLPRGDG